MATLADLQSFLWEVAIPGTLKAVLADPEDDKILECAAGANASHLVTGDRRHLLPMKSFQGIVIVSADEFLGLMGQP